MRSRGKRDRRGSPPLGALEVAAIIVRGYTSRMNLASRFRPRPFTPGTPAPLVSLTAHDGSWVQSGDYIGRNNLVLLFFHAPTGAEGEMLRGFEAQRETLEELDTLVFGVNQDRPDKLRSHHAALEISFPLLYDLLALTSRTFRQSGRRPYVRTGVMVIDKKGSIALHEAATTSADAIVALVRSLEGRPEEPESRADVDWLEAEQLLSGEDAHCIVDVRTKSEFDALHVPGALHIPVDELPQRYAELGTTSRILTVCQVGARSANAANFLKSMGCTEVYSVRGGMAEWPGRPGTR